MGHIETLDIRKLTLNDKVAFLAGLKEWEGEDSAWHSFAWQEGIDADVRRELSERWTPDLWQKILCDTKTAPAWVCDVIRNIAKEKQKAQISSLPEFSKTSNMVCSY